MEKRHLDTRARARVSRAHAKPGAVALTPAQWASVKAACPPTRGGLFPRPKA